MTEKCLLFVYGLLTPGRPNAPRTTSQDWPDRIRGVLYDLGTYPGAVGVGMAAAGWIEGHVLEIDCDELPELDAFEDTESGEFRRVLVETADGHLVWVYEYLFPVPEGLAPITKWPPV